MSTFAYHLLFLLHISAIVVAFAPAFVWPMVSMRLKKEGKPVGSTIAALTSGNTTKIHGPAMVLAGLFGFGMIGLSHRIHSMSKTPFEFQQAWISIAMVLWFALIGVMFGLMAPAEKKAANGDVDADKKLSMYGGFVHLLFFLMLIVMIWKPGFHGAV